MLQIALSIAPVFLLIVLGHALRRGGIPSIEFWNLNDKLVYWVLFPALLFHNTSASAVSTELVGAYAVVIVGAFAAAVVFALVVSRALRLDGPVASSLLQGCARHNTFIALAVAERLFGTEGLALAALATALLIPVTNVTVVGLMVVQLRGPGEKGVAGAIARDLARNPLLLAVVLGLVVNYAGVAPIAIVHDMTAILGGAALPVVLLCIGANIRVRAMAASLVPTSLSFVGKLVVFPALILILARAVGLSNEAALVALLFGAVPTAASAYTLARQMGGDAPLMASMITLQTAAAFLTLPLTITLARVAIG